MRLFPYTNFHDINLDWIIRQLKIITKKLEDGGGNVQPSDATPQPLGTASPGVSPDYSRADHVHQMPTIQIPYASNSTPQPLGASNAGTSYFYSRGDHVHEKPTYTASDVGAVPAPVSPSSGDYLTWNGSAWVAASLPLYNGGVG